jgi:protein phosphatase
VGSVRETNEDAVLEAGNLFAVADGMGGHQAGEVASSLALSVIGQYVEDNLGLIGGDALVEKAISAANAAVHRKASSSAKYREMGTTVTLLYREGDTAYIGHIGDSRAYLYRGGSLKRLTEDHSLVQLLVSEGEISEEEARSHPQRNIITRALGLEPQVEVDVVSVKIEPGDVYLLATDGLTGMVADLDIERVLESEQVPGEAARRLVENALAAGGSDNVSIVLVSIKGSDTVVPARDVRLEAASDGGAAPGMEKRGKRRRVVAWTVAVVIALAILGAGLAVTYYYYNNTYFVGAKGGRVTLFKGFPFWDLASVEKQTDIQVKFLPDALKRRVEDKLEPESLAEAKKTLANLEDEAERNSVLVPDVEGGKFPEARDKLDAAGLTVELQLVSRPGIEENTVIKQDPVPGTRVGRGSQVRLEVVMAGPPAKEV